MVFVDIFISPLYRLPYGETAGIFDSDEVAGGHFFAKWGGHRGNQWRVFIGCGWRDINIDKLFGGFDVKISVENLNSPH